MKLDRILGNIRMDELRKTDPELHEELLEFCSQLDYEKFPEAVKIVKGKYKTLAGFSKLYGKMLERKKEKKMKEQLEEAEKIVLGMAALHARKRKPAAGRRKAAPLSGKLMGRGIVEGVAGEGSRKKPKELFDEAEKLKKDADENAKKGDDEKASLLYEQSASKAREASWTETEPSKKLEYAVFAAKAKIAAKKDPVREWINHRDISVENASELLERIFSWLKKEE